MDTIITDESVTVAGVVAAHNEQRWRSATNRHTNTDGSSWGWIEGAPGRICWSDNERFNSVAAAAMVRAHNEWLENIQPLAIKVIKARREHAAARQEFEDLEAKATKAQERLFKARAALDSLLSEQGA